MLAASLTAGLLVPRGVTLVAAQDGRPDRDGDGLYDDDEADVYGTNPDVYDTDGDGVGDGEEVYVGTDPLTGGAAPAPPEEGGYPDLVPPPNPDTDLMAPCAAGLTDCGNYCANVSQDAANCGLCGWDCGSRDLYFCYLGMCVGWCPVGSRRCTGEYICRNYNEPCPA